jgi:cytidine deaminase
LPEDLTLNVRTAAEATGHHMGCAEIGALCDLESQGEPLVDLSAQAVKVTGGSQGYPVEDHLDPVAPCGACRAVLDYLNDGDAGLC